ncbi:MAG: hypothetical protein H8E55_63970 [Pelagibacterales bacterium]|nr:hypothetical protein [Pelagibacterales bacterium]
MEHTFCLVLPRDINEIVAAKYFMSWMKDTVEFVLPNNTLTTPTELFTMMKTSEQISKSVNRRESDKFVIYYTKQQIMSI